MDFELLKDFAKIVAQNKIKNIEILGNSNKKSNKLDLFYNNLINGALKNEKEAVRFLFKSFDPKYPSYVNLKNKLIKQLINTSIFIDTERPEFNERAKSYFLSYKYLAASSVLLARDASSSAVYLLQIILDQSIKYEFIDLAVDASKLLRWEYSRISYNFEKSCQYAELHRKYEEKRRYEAIAFDYHENLIIYYLKKNSPNKELHEKATKYFDELSTLLNDVDTSKFYKYTYSIGIIKYESINDTKNALLMCDQALDVLTKRKNVNRTSIAGFKLQKLSLFRQIKYKDKVIIENLFNECMNVYEVGNFSWIRAYEMYIYFLLSISDYEEALNLYGKAINEFTSVRPNNIVYENWLLLGGYLHLISRFGLLDASEVEQVVGKFKYSKIYNEIEILKKDKEGMNIPLLLLPVLYELAQAPKDRTKEIPIEALDKYRQRWLANDMNRRSNSFLKILLTLAQSAGTSIVNEKKIKKEWEILKNETPDVAGQSFAIEIIPYETLIELLFAKWGLSGILQPEASS